MVLDEPMTTALTTLRIGSPLGELHLCARGDALTAVHLPAQPPPADARAGTSPVLARAAAQLTAYFAGERQTFDLPLAPRGTAFQELVWRTLVRIPFGETWSYGELARAVERGPAASRAVGAANARNPLTIIVPCHRVIGAGGALTGYAGGVAAKQWLLEHERGLAARGRLRHP